MVSSFPISKSALFNKVQEFPVVTIEPACQFESVPAKVKLFNVPLYPFPALSIKDIILELEAPLIP